MLDFAVTAFASVLFVMDPVGAVPAYLVLTGNEQPAQRRRTALKASVTAVVLLSLFAAAGNALFRVLGLTLPAFQVAGGVLLFAVALDMMKAQRPTQEDPGELREGEAKEDVALTPLAVPMLAGPASLSTVATLMSRARGWPEVSSVYLAVVLAGAITYLTLRLAGPLHQRLGQAGVHVFSRVFGLLLAAIAVQFVLDGLRHRRGLSPAAGVNRLAPVNIAAPTGPRSTTRHQSRRRATRPCSGRGVPVARPPSGCECRDDNRPPASPHPVARLLHAGSVIR